MLVLETTRVYWELLGQKYRSKHLLEFLIIKEARLFLASFFVRTADSLMGENDKLKSQLWHESRFLWQTT